MATKKISGFTDVGAAQAGDRVLGVRAGATVRVSIPQPSGSQVEVVDSLTSTDADAALSANQGRVLSELLEELVASGGVSLTGINIDNSDVPNLPQEDYERIRIEPGRIDNFGDNGQMQLNPTRVAGDDYSNQEQRSWMLGSTEVRGQNHDRSMFAMSAEAIVTMDTNVGPDTRVLTFPNKSGVVATTADAAGHTYATFAAIPGQRPAGFITVTADETNAGAKTLYHFDGTTLWKLAATPV